MILENGQLNQLLKTLKKRLRLTWLWRTLAFTCPLFAVLWLSGLFSLTVTLFLTLAAFVLLFAWNREKDRSSWPTSARLVNHLDRTHEEMEDSAELLLMTERELGPIQQMQRQRISQRLSQLSLTEQLPTEALKRAQRNLFFGLGLAAMVLALMPILPRGLARQGVDRFREALKGSDGVATAEVAITNWRIQIEPPAYTQLPAQTHDEPALKVAQGSRVQWKVGLSQRVDDLIVHHRPGESLRLGSGKQFEWGLVLEQPGYYYLEFQSKGDSQISNYFPLEVINDQAPSLTVLQPLETRTDIPEGSRSAFRIELEASDDYGLASGQLVVTVAKGNGENVKFRERTWPLSGWEQGSARERKLHATLDFPEWDATWGNELYFHVELTDNRLPEPNQTRSDTYFLVLLGGDRPQEVDTEGIVVRPVRAYFRSQRQIIIDTEKLLAQQSQITSAEFRRRSESLGVDQKILRLRYGQFLGEEFESAIEMDFEPSQAEAEDHHGHDHDHGAEASGDAHAEIPGHDHEDETASGFQETNLVTDRVQDLLPGGLLHDHDNAETNTFFDPEMKLKLKDALSEMWQSELYLRTIEPKKALPYQYRALKMIKDLQQMSRVYEQRVGIETPPLQPEKKRLTGERKNMARLKAVNELAKEDPHADLRQAWQWLETRKPLNAEMLARVTPALEKAAQRDPNRFLEALEALSGLQRDEDSCGDCRQKVAAALWSLMPDAEPKPRPREKPRGGLSQAYLDSLGQRP